MPGNTIKFTFTAPVAYRPARVMRDMLIVSENGVGVLRAGTDLDLPVMGDVTVKETTE